LEIARCFRDEKRMDDAIKHWVAGARLARSIGWSSAYRYALNVFVFDLEKPHRPFGARQRLLGDANWLRPGQANVHCFRSGPNVFAIVLQKGRVRAEWIGEFDSISERISELARLGRHAAGSSRWLVSKFEAPLKLGKDNRRVHIVVDREFVMVPFEAIYSTASVTRGRRYSGRAAPMHAGDAKGALLLDWRKDGWSHAESTRKLFDRIEDLNWPDVRLLEAAMAARPRWKVVVRSTIRRTVAELIGSTPDGDDAESEVREWLRLARRFGRPRSKRSDIKMHVLVLPSGPVALPLDDGEPFKTASMTIAVRSAQTVLCLAYEIPEKSKTAFLEKFLQELNGTVSGKPVNAATAASRARRNFAVREDLPAEHAWAWQLWVE